MRLCFTIFEVMNQFDKTTYDTCRTEHIHKLPMSDWWGIPVCSSLLCKYWNISKLVHLRHARRHQQQKSSLGWNYSWKYWFIVDVVTIFREVWVKASSFSIKWSKWLAYNTTSNTVLQKIKMDVNIWLPEQHGMQKINHNLKN